MCACVCIIRHDIPYDMILQHDTPINGFPTPPTCRTAARNVQPRMLVLQPTLPVVAVVLLVLVLVPEVLPPT